MKNKVIWITGLVDSGKTTIALALQKQIPHSIVLDANILRDLVSYDLGFSIKDRQKNVLRAGGIAKLLFDQDKTVIVAIISPNRADRKTVREMFSPGDFIEVFNNTPLDVCEKRDTKGLYKRQRHPTLMNRILNATKMALPGIKSGYEKPLNPDLLLDTTSLSVPDCVNKILDLLNNL